MAAPKKFSRRGRYGQWSSKDLEDAIACLRNKELGLNECARRYSVPKATLKRHAEGSNTYAIGGIKHFGPPTEFPPDLECKLVEHVLKLDELYFGVTVNDLCSLAYQLATQNNVRLKFNPATKSAGKKWYRAFMNRHPELSLRQPEATSIARALGFNKQSIDHFFSLLEEIISKSNLSSSSIFNMDESGLTTVQKPNKTISVKGKKQVGGIASGERGTNTTVVCCVNAAGRYIPPMLIFKRKRMIDALKDGAPPGSLIVNNESGWMDQSVFLIWMQHFQQEVKSSKENPVLLILDGHSSHTKNLEAIDFARDNGITMLSLPPHTTHKLQPLDRCFFKPLKSYFNDASDKWLRNNPGRCITVFQISLLFAEAYMKSATMPNAVNGFAKCGLWPCDKTVFSDVEFQPAVAFSSTDELTTDAVTESQIAEDKSLHQTNQTALSNVQDDHVDTDDPTGPIANIIILENEDDAAHDVSNTTQVQSLSQKTLIKAYPDGRCFFRSVATAMKPALQNVQRDTFGLILNPKMRQLEQDKADSLRGEMTRYMTHNLREFTDYDSSIVNADLPMSSNISERIIAMSNNTELVGELEIIAVCKSLRRQIHVVVEGNTRKYGEE